MRLNSTTDKISNWSSSCVVSARRSCWICPKSLFWLKINIYIYVSARFITPCSIDIVRSRETGERNELALMV